MPVDLRNGDMTTETTVHEIDFRRGPPSPDDRKRFCDDGVIVVRNLFDPPFFAGIILDLEKRIALLENRYGIDVRADAATGTSVPELGRLSARIEALEARRPGLQSVLYDAMSRSPAMHSAAADSAVIDLIGNFVEPPVAHHDRFILLMSQPQKTWHLAGWHQDWYYNEGPDDTVTFYAPLQRTDETNGMLLFALGAHCSGLMPHGEFDGGFRTKWHVIDPHHVAQFERIAAPALDLGDVALFKSLVPHSARVNTGSAIRFVLNFRYHGLNDSAFVDNGWRVQPAERARTALLRPQQ